MRHVLLVGVDGLRIDDALAGDDVPMPTLAALARDGGFADMTMEVPTISGPGWASILTGASHAEHGIVDNTFHGNRLLDHPDLLSRAWFADQSVTTWAAGSWLPLLDPTGPGPVVWWREEAQRAQRHQIMVRDGETRGYREADGEVVDWTRLALRGMGPRVSFVYLGEIDLAGHVYGGVSPQYDVAMRRVDAHLATIVAAVRERLTAFPEEEWLLTVTTDHGHLDAGGHGGAEEVLRRSFVVSALLTARVDPTGGAPAISVSDPGLPARMEPTEITPFLLAQLLSSGA